MPDFSIRSYQKEILDKDDIPFEDIKQNMKELNIINQKLGGHVITISGLKKFLPGKTNSLLCIAEIGCGGGDNLSAINNYCHKIKQPVSFMGIDIKQSCIEYAKQQHPQMNTEWIVSDYSKVEFTNNPDIIFSSLFCHHFTNEELVFMLKWMKDNTKLGFFINDLQRHPLAWFLIKWITRLFSKSYLVKNDAPVSVTRGFTKKEWKQLLTDAGIEKYSIQWKWAFRFLIVVKNAG
ncbi:MAG: methyltransferase domain-containing protein [Ferruginibacter sp.]